MLPSLLTPTFAHVGLLHELTIEAYHAGPGLSHTGLTRFARSPSHYFALHRDPNRPPEIDKAGQLAGRLAHCMILEPGEFAFRYAIGPELHRNTNAWKDFVAAHTRQECIQPADFERATAQRRSVMADPDIAQLLGRGKAEVSAYWHHPATGTLCRCRPDWVHPVDGVGVILCDVKTYSNADPEEFARQVARKRYHWQAAFYTDGYSIASGVPVVGFVFLAVEDQWPYACSATMLDEESLDVARREIAVMLEHFSVCEERNHWPGYGPGIQQIGLPRWYAVREE